MALPPEQVLAARYTLQHNRLRLSASTAMGRAWDRLAGLSDLDAARFADTAATLALSAQSQAAASVDGYLALVLDFAAGQGSPLGIDTEAVTGAAVRAGTAPTEVYHRAIVTARVAISNGQTFADAMRAGRRRAVSSVDTDLALTQRAAMVNVAGTDKRIVGYRRVLTGKSCALCASASTQRYRSGQLMPIHGHCDCGVAPIIGEKDPGKTINQELVRDLKAAGRQTGDPAYWKSRHITVDADGSVTLPDITVHQHGELGPVLTDARHSFTGPGELAA